MTTTDEMTRGPAAEADAAQTTAAATRAPDDHGDRGSGADVPDGRLDEDEPGGYGAFVAGGFAGLIGLGGLAVASGAHEGAMYAVGMLVFLGSIAFVFWLMKRGFDREELRARRRG